MVALNPETQVVHVQPVEVLQQAILQRGVEPFDLLPDKDWIASVAVFVALKGPQKIPDQMIFVVELCNWIRLDGLTLKDLQNAFDRMNSVEVMAELDYGADKFRTILSRVVRDQIRDRRRDEQEQRIRQERRRYQAQVDAEEQAKEDERISLNIRIGLRGKSFKGTA